MEEKKNCLRCHSELQNQEKDLCIDCENLIEKAFNLIETNQEVYDYYKKVQIQQKKAAVRLEKLKYLYNNDKTDSLKLLKKTVNGVRRLYRFNLLESGVNSVKKIFKPDLEKDKPTEEDLLVEEILELEQFISIDPIEFVIHKYVTPPEEKEDVSKEEKKNNVFKETIDYFTKEKFSKLSKEKQVKISLGFVIVVGILMICISFL
jgi:hypothetical protein